MARAAAIALLLLVGGARAGDRSPVIVVPGGPVIVQPPPASCWQQPRYFETLRSGVVDYCRRNLAWHPGRLECYWIAERVCDVYDTNALEWVRTAQLLDPVLFPCPPGDPPPVCPRLGGLGIGQGPKYR